MNTPDRRFTILDAMILVAATAAGFALLRAIGMDLTIGSTGRMWYYRFVSNTLKVLLPSLTTWTVACLIIRLRQPRPDLRRLVRQPGMIACSAAALAAVLEAVVNIRLFALSVSGGEWIFLIHAPEVSFSIGGAWLTLALSGRWKSERNWIDRLGRALGFAWIIVTVIRWSSFFLL